MAVEIRVVHAAGVGLMPAVRINRGPLVWIGWIALTWLRWPVF